MTEKEDKVSSDPEINQELVEALPKLTPEQVKRVSPKLVRQIYSPGQAIINQGEPPECFYIVISGKVEILHESLSGSSSTVDLRGPGHYFGEIGLLQNRPRSATVRAWKDGDVDVLALHREDFEEMMDESKATETLVAREMIQRLIELADFQS